MQKIILYYIFLPIDDPDAVRLWQYGLCERLGLKGRILISTHGLNGTLGGALSGLRAYIKETRSYPGFSNIDFKWSEGSSDHFPKLSVKVRPEIVTFGHPEEIIVNENGIVGGGEHLSPEEVHELIRKRSNEVVFFDGRNAFESAVGRFKQAVVPNVAHSRDFVRELESDKFQELKNKPVVTYCTGGIRCEVLSVLMKNRGFKEVYQIDGGIVSYGERFGDEGLWEGALYVFDGRIDMKFSDQAKDIGICSVCKRTTSRYINCANPKCNRQILVCEGCQAEQYCRDCSEQAAQNSVRIQR